MKTNFSNPVLKAFLLFMQCVSMIFLVMFLLPDVMESLLEIMNKALFQLEQLATNPYSFR